MEKNNVLAGRLPAMLLVAAVVITMLDAAEGVRNRPPLRNCYVVKTAHGDSHYELFRDQDDWPPCNNVRKPFVPGDEVKLYCPSYSAGGQRKSFPQATDVIKIGRQNLEGNNRATMRLLLGPVINLGIRECNLWYWNASDKSPPELLGKVDFGGGICNRKKYEPVHAHFSLTENDREMRLTWTALDFRLNLGRDEIGRCVEKPVTSVVYWRTDSPTVTRTAFVKRRGTFNWTDMCDYPAKEHGTPGSPKRTHFIYPRMTFEAVLTDLEPNTMYSCWYGVEGLYRGQATFLSPSVPGDPNSSFVMIAISDLGVWGSEELRQNASGMASDEKTAIAAIRNHVTRSSEKIGLIAHLGGLSFARGSQILWERFLYRIKPLATFMSYHVVAGQYEYGKKSGGECGVPFNKRFHMPQKVVGGISSNGSFWYSHNAGNVHLAYISTTHDISKQSAQYRWLARDLHSVDRWTYPWVFVLGNELIINVTATHNGCTSSLTKNQSRDLVELLLNNDVSLYLAGGCRAFSHACVTSKSTVSHKTDLCKHSPAPDVETDLKAPGLVQVTVGTPSAIINVGNLTSFPAKAKALHGFTKIRTLNNSYAEVQFFSLKNERLDKIQLTAANPEREKRLLRKIKRRLSQVKKLIGVYKKKNFKCIATEEVVNRIRRPVGKAKKLLDAVLVTRLSQ